MSAKVPMGTIVAYAMSEKSVPDGWLVCDGSPIDNEKYPDFITLLGETSTPDLRGRTLIGAGSTLDNNPQSDGTTPNFPSAGFPIGATGGECSHQLATAEVPSHIHTLTNGGFSESGGGNNFQTPPSATNEPTYDKPNSAVAHNNMQPYYVVNYIICATDS